MRVDPVVQKYLERYAAPEAALAARLDERYQAVLVVPAFAEEASLLDGYGPALSGAPGRVLVIVVVNAAAERAVEHWPRHAELLAQLCAGDARLVSSTPPAWLARRGTFDLLVLDRASPEWCLPAREGVGLARRIGCDLGLAAVSRGQVADDFLYCTDADASLPRDYFTGGPDIAHALVFGFRHVPGGDGGMDAATVLYELSLRYFVASLAAAGSPYAHHTVGSCLAVRASAYAQVRGFPRRLAGEDFYLLAKVAKTGAVWRDERRIISLRSRDSARTAHGTGLAARAIAGRANADEVELYEPLIFRLLAAWLRALEQFAEQPDVELCRVRLGRAAGEHAEALDAALTALGAWPAFEAAARAVRSPEALYRRLHTWFDAFRTLKLVHALRARGLPSVPFRDALARSELCGAAQARGLDVAALRELLARKEAEFSPITGFPFRHAAHVMIE